MKIGLGLPQFGEAAGPESLAKVSQGAESLGYDSLWVLDRILFPVNPQTPYPATADGSLPEPMRIVLDPLEALTFVAAHTKTVGLGTSVLDIPFYNPVMLARSLTTLDVLSGGRARVGLGLGWSQDEYDAVNVSPKDRGKRADEFLQVMKAIWTSDPVEFKGTYYTVPPSHVLPKPVQKPHPPIYLAAYAPAALNRIARLANGWMPTGIPLGGMVQMMDGVRAMAAEAGRDPSSLELIVRANLYHSPEPLGDERWIFTGAWDQIRSDVAAVREIGAVELILEPGGLPQAKSASGYLEMAEQLRELV